MKYEENLLKELNYIDTDEHKNSHKKYIKAVEEYSQNIKNGDSESIYKLINYVKSWWIEHITTEDVKYKSFLLNNNFN
jgi:hemerythrin-like metal-binding protein